MCVCASDSFTGHLALIVPYMRLLLRCGCLRALHLLLFWAKPDKKRKKGEKRAYFASTRHGIRFKFIKVAKLTKTSVTQWLRVCTHHKLWSFCWRNSAWMRDCNLNKEISFHQGVIFAVCELTHYMSPSIHTLRACPPHVLGIHMLAKTPSPCITNERINKAFIRDTGGWFPLWIKERWKLEAVQVGHSYQVSMCSKETGLKPKWKSSLQGKPQLNDVWFTGTHVMCCGYTKKHILMTYKHSKIRKKSYKTTVTLRRKQ